MCINKVEVLEESKRHCYDIIRVIVFLAGIVMIQHGTVGLLSGVSIRDIVIAIATQISAIILPGISIYILLYPKKQTMLGTACISYILGYAWNIVLYFLLIPFGLKSFVPIVVGGSALFSTVFNIKMAFGFECKKSEKQDGIYLFLFLIFFILSVFAYDGANASPVVTNSAWIPTDHLYWIENAVALAKGFPAYDLRLALEDVLYYHYFSSIQIAFTSITTGIDCYTLGTTFGSVAKSFVFFGAIYVFISGITKRIWLRLLGIVGLVFSSGLAGGDILFTYTCHTWTHPFGFDMGFAFAAFFLHCFYMQYKNEKIDYRVLLLSVLSMLMCTGLKAPVAAVTIVAAGVVCFGWLVKKQFRLAFTYGFSLLLAFGIVMVFCVGFTKSSDSSVGGFSVWHNIRESTEFLRITYDRIPAGIPEFLKVATMLLVFIFGSNMLVFGVCFVSGTVSLFDRRMWTTQVLGLLLSAATGTFLGAFNVQDGSSQMYFLMSALIPSMAVGLIWLENEYDGWGKIGKCCVSVVLTGFLAAQVLAMLALDFTYWGNGLENAFRLGYINLFCKDKAQQDFRIDGLQRDNVEALKWIRENTPEDSIVLSDRSVVGDMSQYMYYGVFSERQAYLEGDVYYRQRFVEERDQMRSIIGRVYQNDVSALKEAIDDGVDYVVQTKWLTPDFVPDLEWIKLVFSSESINVYEVINQE